MSILLAAAALIAASLGAGAWWVADLLGSFSGDETATARRAKLVGSYTARAFAAFAALVACLLVAGMLFGDPSAGTGYGY